MDKAAAIESLTRQVQAASVPVYMTSKAEIVDFYRTTFGHRDWTHAAAEKLSGSSDVYSKEYRAAIRQFQGGREDKEARKGPIRARFQELGKQLPPKMLKPPPGGYKVSFNGHVKISGGRKKKTGAMRGDGWAKASFTRQVTGAAAQDLLLNGGFGPVFTTYFDNFPQNPVADYQVGSISVS